MFREQFGKLVKDKLKEYPDLPSRTLARLIYHLNPQIFKSVESVRCCIRYYRGKMGNTSKKSLINKYGKPF